MFFFSVISFAIWCPIKSVYLSFSYFLLRKCWELMWNWNLIILVIVQPLQPYLSNPFVLCRFIFQTRFTDLWRVEELVSLNNGYRSSGHRAVFTTQREGENLCEWLRVKSDLHAFSLQKTFVYFRKNVNVSGCLLFIHIVFIFAIYTMLHNLNIRT